MSCERHREQIDALVDGTLGAADRAALEAHLATCPECRELADDLRAIRRTAEGLPELSPPARAWAAISARLEPPVAVIRPVSASWRQRLGVPLAIAALLLAAVAITMVMRRVRSGDGPATAATATGTATTAAPAAAAAARPAPTADAPPQDTSADLRSLELELQQAEAHYEKAIGKLEVLAKDRRALDPNVAAVLAKNQHVIDAAIGESRAALRAQPASEQAQESLFEAFRSKIALLQDTISLINEVRKGNQAEAGRIADGLNKS